MNIEAVLVADSGWAAARIARAAHDLGLRAVGIRGGGDEGWPRHLDQLLLPSPPGGSSPTTTGDEIAPLVSLAQRAGVDALHPGRGHLADSAPLAAALAAAGIAFIGPTAAVLELLANKARWKERAEQVGVPVLPGAGRGDQAESLDDLLDAALEIGFPLLVKPADGRDGRGLRPVENTVALRDALAAARAEGSTRSGGGGLIVEQYLDGARAIEVVLLRDCQGRCLAVGDRDVTLQSAFRPRIVEAPAPDLGPELREWIVESCERLVQSLELVGMANFGVLVEDDDSFFVHSVTSRLPIGLAALEAVLDLDLVAWSLRLVEGELLPAELRSSPPISEPRCVALAADLGVRGGPILHLELAGGGDLQWDHVLQEGVAVTDDLDLESCTVVARDRSGSAARRRLRWALSSSRLVGVRDDRHVLLELLRSNVGVEGGPAATGSAVPKSPGARFPVDPGCTGVRETEPPLTVLSVAAVILMRGLDTDWCSPAWLRPRIRLFCGQWAFSCSVGKTDDGSSGLLVEVLAHHGLADEPVEHVDPENLAEPVRLDRLAIETAAPTRWGTAAQADFEEAGVQHRIFVFQVSPSRLFVEADGHSWWIESEPAAMLAANDSGDTWDDGGDGVARAAMPARVGNIKVVEGDPVLRGQTVMHLSALDLELVVRAPVDGVVDELLVASGDAVDEGQALVRVAPSGP